MFLKHQQERFLVASALACCIAHGISCTPNFDLCSSATGRSCGSSGDCLSHRCDNGKCGAPLCNDGILNGAETDVDCGIAPGSDSGFCGEQPAPLCSPCGEGKRCYSDTDCESGHCSDHNYDGRGRCLPGN